MTKHQNFDLLWGPKWPRNWALEAHIVHICESSSNDHNKQDWCKSRGNFLTKYFKTWILTPLEAQNILHTYKSSSNELVNQVSSESSRNFSRKYTKTYMLTYFDLIWGQKGPQIWPTGAIFQTHLKISTICLWTKFHGPRLKSFWENGQKPTKFPFFTYIL